MSLSQSSSVVQPPVTLARYGADVSQSENGPAAPAGRDLNGSVRPNGFHPAAPAASTDWPQVQPQESSGEREPAPQPVNPSSDGFDEERSRLEAELATAQARLDAARHRRALAEAEMNAALRREIAASRATLADLDRQHEESLSMVRRSTEAEVARIIAEAHAADRTTDEATS